VTLEGCDPLSQGPVGEDARHTGKADHRSPPESRAGHRRQSGRPCRSLVTAEATVNERLTGDPSYVLRCQSGAQAGGSAAQPCRAFRWVTDALAAGCLYDCAGRGLPSASRARS
jgi:hypothetical protein